MLRETEIKLFGAIDILESALNDLCRRPEPRLQDQLGRAKFILQESISCERKVIDGH